MEDRIAPAGLGLVADNATHSVVTFDSDTNTVLGSVVLPGSGGGTGDVVITDDGSLGFVTDFGSRVWVIDLADPTNPTVEPTPIAISNFGFDMAITPDQQFLVVVDGNFFPPLSVVDIASRSEIGTFDLGGLETAVDVSETGSVLVSVGSGGPNGNRVRQLTIDGSGTLTDTGDVLSASNPFNVYAAPGGTFGVALSSDGVQSFEIAGLTPIDSTSILAPIAAVFNPAGDRLYVRAAGGSAVSKVVNAYSFDPATGDLSSSPLFSIPVSNTQLFAGVEQLSLSPDGTRLYVPDDGSDAVNVYNASNGTFLGSITHPNIQEPTGIAIVQTGLSVSGTDPANGSVVFTKPTEYVVNVSEPVDPGTLEAADFQVNGNDATGVAYTPGTTTITFTFANDPVTTQGVQTMHVTEGAFESASEGMGVSEFNGTFRFDAVLMQVMSTYPADGSTILLPATTLDLNFNEDYDVASAQPIDFTLNQGSVSAVSQVDADTLRLTLDGVVAEGTLSVDMAAGAMTDTFGNPGAAFSGSYILDFGSTPYPVPLTPKEPLGSLIYDPSASGIINPPGDTDTFTISVDPGQTLTVAVQTDAGLQASVTLLAGTRGNNVVATGTASAPGDEVVLQPVTTAGQLNSEGQPAKTYRIVLAGANDTTGSYTVQMVLNAALENESHGGGSNDTLETAQDLEPSFLQLHRASNADNSGAQPARAAVLGTADGVGGYTASAVAYAFEDISGTGTPTLQGYDNGYVQINPGGGFNFDFYGHSYTSLFASSNGLITFGSGNSAYSNTDLTSFPNQATISPFWDDLDTIFSGTVYWDLLDAGTPNERVIIQWEGVHFLFNSAPITFQAVLRTDDNSIQFNYLDLDGSRPGQDNGGSATVGIKDAGSQGSNRLFLAYNNGPNEYVGTGQSTLITPVTPTADYYSFHLDAGASATVALTGQDEGTLDVELLDSDGTVIATGSSADNLSSVVSDFIAEAAGTYYVRVTGAQIQYSLLVTRNADFDTEGNNNIASAQEVLSTQVAGRQWVLGHVSGEGGLLAADDGDRHLLLVDPATGAGTIVASNVGGGRGYNALARNPVTDVLYGSQSLNGRGLYTIDPTSYAETYVGNLGGNVRALAWSPDGTTLYGFRDSTLGTIDPTTAAFTPIGNSGIFLVGGMAFQPGTGTLFAVSNIRPGLYTIDLGTGAATYVGNPLDRYNSLEFLADGTLLAGVARPSIFFGGGNLVELDPATAAPTLIGTTITSGRRNFTGLEQLVPTTDFYQVTLVEGTPLVVETGTPGSGGGEFDNLLDPMVRIYDADGNLVASDDNSADDGRNALLTYDVPEGGGGTYYVEVSFSDATDEPTSGEYILSIAGNVAGDNLYLDGDPIADGSTATPVTNEALRSAVDYALAYWQAAGVDTSSLSSIPVRSGDLVGSMLGHAFSDVIVIDTNAAGHGWSLGAGGPAGTLDLNHTMVHEFGHLLGFGPTGEFAVMRPTLRPIANSPATSLQSSPVAPTRFVAAASRVTAALPTQVAVDRLQARSSLVLTQPNASHRDNSFALPGNEAIGFASQSMEFTPVAITPAASIDATAATTMSLRADVPQPNADPLLSPYVDRALVASPSQGAPAATTVSPPLQPQTPLIRPAVATVASYPPATGASASLARPAGAMANETPNAQPREEGTFWHVLFPMESAPQPGSRLPTVEADNPGGPEAVDALFAQVVEAESPATVAPEGVHGLIGEQTASLSDHLGLGLPMLLGALVGGLSLPAFHLGDRKRGDLALRHR